MSIPKESSSKFQTTSHCEATTLSEVETTLATRFITNVDELIDRLELPLIPDASLATVAQNYSLRLPETILNRISKGNVNDPVLKQFLPDNQELTITPGFSYDPLCERLESIGGSAATTSSNESSCILQKYHGRVLVLTTNECAARCRFCFRRHSLDRAMFPIPEKYRNTPGQDNTSNLPLRIREYFDLVFAPVRKDESIHEIIFSGGDPLTLSNDYLKALLNYIKSIKTVNRVRFHSRIPILTPQRVNDSFPGYDDIVTNSEGAPFVLHITLHVNSPNEINDEVALALLKLRQKGYVLTSQTTLLRGINDSCETLVQLFETLANCGVVPYYLHQFDRVQGGAHFETSVSKGLSLMEEIAKRLPGYAVPKYVKEIPGEPGKTNLLAHPDATICYQ